MNDNTTIPMRLVAMVRSDQKAWLQSKTTHFRSLADVLREVLDDAMARDRAGER